ncbi:transposase [Mesorhizobium caraganae]|uniref:transposase n=1 Tax=Mesorhizobium caraganae TaxID=483206 RepID=UPI00193A0C8A|nr:transposase [Mesorhizobium caraganae]MBM2713571.1 transposase [Mesorhizobium caraganae]
MSPVTRLEIVGTGRRRRWSEEEKLRIVEDGNSAPRQASATARRHGISNPLLFACRKAYREGRLGKGGVCGFVQATIVPEQPTHANAGESQPERDLRSRRKSRASK